MARTTFSYAQDALCGGPCKKRTSLGPRPEARNQLIQPPPPPEGEYCTVNGDACGEALPIKNIANWRMMVKAKRDRSWVKAIPVPMTDEVWAIWREHIGTPVAMAMERVTFHCTQHGTVIPVRGVTV